MLWFIIKGMVIVPSTSDMLGSKHLLIRVPFHPFLLLFYRVFPIFCLHLEWRLRVQKWHLEYPYCWKKNASQQKVSFFWPWPQYFLYPTYNNQISTQFRFDTLPVLEMKRKYNSSKKSVKKFKPMFLLHPGPNQYQIPVAKYFSWKNTFFSINEWFSEHY